MTCRTAAEDVGAAPGAEVRAVRRVLDLLPALLLFAALAVAAPVAAQSAEGGGVHGQVVSEATGLPLPNAIVEVYRDDWSGGAVTDARGGYRVEGVPSGRNLVRVRHIGHATFELEIVVAGAHSVALDVTLPVQPVALEPVRVESGGERAEVAAPGTPDSELALAGARTIEASPGLTELGIADAVRGVPDQDPADPGSILYVRGAAADLKLVYLDGAPVYAPFPLGGLMAPFTPDLLHRADVYLGGAPARYDGGLSYVMDLRTRGGGGEGVRTSGSVDLMSARALVEAPLGDRAGVVAGIRGMHPFATRHLLDEALPYGYSEALVRGDLRFGETGLVAFTGFGNDEAVRIGATSAGDSTIRWGNDAMALRVSGRLGSTAAEITASRGDYEARLPFNGARPLLAEAGARRSRIAMDFGRRADALQLRYGASFDRQEYWAEATSLGAEGFAGMVEGRGEVFGVYGEAIGSLSSRIRVRGGLRLDHFSGGGEIAVAPRAAATLMLTESAALTIAAGRYHQFLRTPDEVLLSTPESLLESGGVPLVVGSASHFTVGLDQDLGEDVRLGVEGYYKTFSDVPSSYSPSSNASGFDLWVRRGGEGWTGWLGYSLAWFWSPGNTPEQADFAGRHLLNAGIGAPITRATMLDVRFAYGAGLPYSAIPIGVQPNDAPMATTSDAPALSAAVRGGTESAPLLHVPDNPFLRIDASLSRPISYRRADRVFEITPYVRVLNGLGQRDALFYLFDGREGSETRAIGSLPLIPVVGFEWKF